MRKIPNVPIHFKNLMPYMRISTYTSIDDQNNIEINFFLFQEIQMNKLKKEILIKEG